jgi:hypothetical protein
MEQRFMTSAQSLRVQASVNAFLAGLPLVMDVNLELGKLMLPTVLDLLRYLPSMDSDLRSQMSLQIPFETNPPQFTLGLLNTQLRFHWLQTLLIVLYKYEYSKETSTTSITNSIKCLVQIVINTLNLQHHQCSLDNPDRPAALSSRHHSFLTGNDGSDHSFDQHSGQRDEFDSFSTNSGLPRREATEASLSNKSLRQAKHSKRSLIENLNLVHTNASNTTSDLGSPRTKPQGSVLNFMADKPKPSRIKVAGRKKFAITLSNLFKTQNRIKKFRK